MIADYELQVAHPRRAGRADLNAPAAAGSPSQRTAGARPRFGSPRICLVESLTPREREIAVLLAAERASNRTISARLSISIRTVETHVERIFAKLGIHTRADVAAAYLS